MSTITLKLFSKFSLVDSEGVDRTPAGTKSKGVIALLALAPEFTRNRGWLQDKLWSDRFAEQSSSSLRQALSNIRRALGEHRDILVTDGDSVSFSRTQFEIDNSLPRLNGTVLETELFPNLDIKDAEFEHWIRDQRHRITPPLDQVDEPKVIPRRPAVPAIIFKTSISGGNSSLGVAIEIINNVTKSLLEFADFNIFSDLMPFEHEFTYRAQQSVTVLLHMSSSGERELAAATIANSVTGQIHWMNKTQYMSNQSQEFQTAKIENFCAHLFENIIESLSEDSAEMFGFQTAGLLNKLGQNLLFQLDKHSLTQADRYLKSAYDMEPRGQYLAWSSFIRNLCLFEHKTLDFLDNEIGMDELLKEAIAQDSTNSNTLAIAAQIEYVQGSSIDRSLYLANLSIQQNPTNAFSSAMLANAYIANGDFSAGSAAAQRALELVNNSKSRFFFEFFCCMAATGNRDYFKAIAHGEAAYYLKPDFRAPLRYLLVLYKKTKQAEKFATAYKQMRKFESEFEITQLLEDSYPAHTLRRLSVISAIENNTNQ